MGMDEETSRERFARDIPEDYHLPAVIDAHARAFGDRTAVRFRDSEGRRSERTFARLRADMDRFANALEALGVGPGDRVLHLLPRHPDVFAVQLGILRRGAILVPCSPMLRPRDIAFRASDCGAGTVVCHASLASMVEEAAGEAALETRILLEGEREGWHAWPRVLAEASDEHRGPPIRASTPMSINYTSGTTGEPKPVLHRHRWIRCFELVNAPFWWGVAAGDDLEDELLWATTGTGWAKWFWSPVGVALAIGAPQLVYEGPFEPRTFLDLLEEEGVTRLCAVPTQYRMFAEVLGPGRRDGRLRAAVSAGEPLNREPIAAFREATGVTPRDGYGQTETVALVANRPGEEVRPGSMGRPLPGLGTTLLALDEEREVGPGQVGEIAVPAECPGVFDGYFERPDLDAETFAGRYYRTGDLASRDEEGFYFFEGRADDVIISAGYRIGPFEVEDALVDHPAVLEAAAVASPHPVRGQVVKAYVVLTGGAVGDEEMARELQAFMKERTAPYKYPRRIEFVESLPKTASGKIRRVELERRERERIGPA